MLRALILLPALLLTGCIYADFGPSERFRDSFHYSYDLQPGGRVSLENSNGSIEISGWDQNKVEVDGEKYASTEAALREVKVDIRNQPDLVDIRTVRPSSSSFFSNSGARYVIHVPRTAHLDWIKSTNGRIDVHDLDAGARLRTSNGKIRGDHIRGGVEAQTSNGGIDLRDIEGGATLQTTNGPIALAMTHPPAANIRAETSNGSITLRLPPDTAARLEASTSNAGIVTDFDISGHARMDRHHISGDIGRSEGLRPMIDLRTSNGHISISRN
jgi:hypothetical protein